MTADRMHDLAEWLRSAPPAHELDYALRKAEAIREWCLASFPVKEGDRVTVARRLNTDNGWKPYAEALTVGATAVVHRIDYNLPHNYWYADIRLDREWSVGRIGDETRRWWNGRAEDTPEGMTPPSRYDQENHPDGRRHLFSVAVEDIKPLCSEATAA